MVLLWEDVKFQNPGINEVVPNQEPVLFSFEPSVFAREPDRTCLLAYLVVHMVYVSHVPLQFDWLFANEFQSSVLSRFQPAWNSRDGVHTLVFGKEAQLEVGDGWVVAPVVQGVMDLSVDVVLYASEVGHMLLLNELLRGQRAAFVLFYMILI